MPITVPKLRELLVHHSILDRMQIHEQWPNLSSKCHPTTMPVNFVTDDILPVPRNSSCPLYSHIPCCTLHRVGKDQHRPLPTTSDIQRNLCSPASFVTSSLFTIPTCQTMCSPNIPTLLNHWMTKPYSDVPSVKFFSLNERLASVMNFSTNILLLWLPLT